MYRQMQRHSGTMFRLQNKKDKNWSRLLLIKKWSTSFYYYQFYTLIKPWNHIIMYKSDISFLLKGIVWCLRDCGVKKSILFYFYGVFNLGKDGSFFLSFLVIVLSIIFFSHIIPLFPEIKCTGGYQLAMGPSILSCWQDLIDFWSLCWGEAYDG